MTLRFHQCGVIIIFALIIIAACTGSSAPKTACDSSLEDRLSLNAFDLFEAFDACTVENRLADANILLLTGQIRAITDMTVLTPKSDKDEKAAIEIYGLIYATYGGVGLDQPYTDEAETQTIFKTLRTEQFSFDESYNPGWAYSTKSRTDLYTGVAKDQLAQRLWTVEHEARLLKIPEYRVAQQASREIYSAGGAISMDSSEADEFARLNNIMREISKDIERAPPPQATVPAYEFYSEPDGIDFRQIASGLNGPQKSTYDIFKTAHDVRNSWVSEIVGAADLEQLLSRIDFEAEALGAYAVGKRTNVSGKIYVTSFDYDAEWKSYSIQVAIGILPESCRFENEPSYPFALAVTSGGEITGSRGSGTNNFLDKCPE